MTKSPLVSVIMPAFNTEKYIGAAIDSILAQTYKNFELIIINDDSRDKTAEIVHSYNDSRIKLLNNIVNLGIPTTRNKAIDQSNGKYIANLDSDDIAAEDRFEIQVKYLERKPETAVCGSHYEAFAEKTSSTIIRQPLMPNQIKARLFFENPIGNSTTMIRNHIFKKDKLRYDESFCIAQDYDLWCKISRKYNIVNLPFVLTKYRKHQEQSSNQRLLALEKDQAILTRQAEHLLKRKLTEEEQKIHFQLMKRLDYTTKPPQKHEGARDWANLLIKANQSNNIYDHKIFESEMNKWLDFLGGNPSAEQI